MADRNAEQDSLFKEIDEDIRQEKYIDLWRKYGKIIISISIAFVLGVAAFKGWEAYNLNQKIADSNQLSSALDLIDQEKQTNAATILNKLIKSGSTGYAILARFNDAAILMKNGKRKKAIANYLSIADDKSIKEEVRNMALILSAQLGIGYMESNIFLDRLKELIDGKNAWRHSAKELTALFAQEAGNGLKARQHFKELSDDATAPQSIRSRAAEMSAALTGKK